MAERVDSVRLSAQVAQYISEMQKAADATKKASEESKKATEKRQAWDQLRKSCVAPRHPSLDAVTRQAGVGMSSEKHDWRDLTRLHPYDVTRADEYQGQVNRGRVAMQAIKGVTVALLAIGAIVLCAFTGAPVWAYAAALGFLLLGALSAVFWMRAHRRSAPPRSERAEDFDSESTV